MLLAATLIGVPVFVTLGGAALVLFWRLHEPIASIPIDHYSLVTNPSLPTMPLFTLAGYFLAEGGAAKRQVRARGAAVVRDAAKHRRLARRHLEAWAHLAAELCRVALR